MTGFGRAEGVVRDRKITVEVRSLNSKQLDLQLKLHGPFREREPELRQWIGERVVRGKAEVHIHAESDKGIGRLSFDRELIAKYYNELKGIADDIAPGANTDLLAQVLRMPDVTSMVQEDLLDDEWLSVLELVHSAMDAFDGFRLDEGARLRTELSDRVKSIVALLKEAEALDQGRVERTRERLQGKLAELKVDVDQARFEQELTYYLEKLDITEEKVRLRAHCTYFEETLGTDVQQGRKLNFITQEMGREINTLGSKANDATIQRTVVLMKDELEKIKEQVLNVL